MFKAATHPVLEVVFFLVLIAPFGMVYDVLSRFYLYRFKFI